MTVYHGTSFTPARTTTGYALFRAGVKVSAGTCETLAASLERRHAAAGTPWRLLAPLAQAVLTVAFLRTNLTCAALAAGFGISPAACWRNIGEGISAPADRGRRISLKDVARLAAKTGRDCLTADGTHVPAVTSGRKTGGQRAFYSGRHKRHGLNVQTACSPHGDLPRAAGDILAFPGPLPAGRGSTRTRLPRRAPLPARGKPPAAICQTARSQERKG